jgi:hypothetical protein
VLKGEIAMTNLKELVSEMSLVWVAPFYNTLAHNAGIVHWSSIPLKEVKNRIRDLFTAKGTLALWKDKRKVIVAWVDPDDLDTTLN